jgi:hypothetical protein
MTGRTRLLSLVVLCWMLGVSDAFAWFGGGWLEKLSGPGPFTGWSVDVRPLCIAGPPPAATPGGPPPPGAPPPGAAPPSTAIPDDGKFPWNVTWEISDRAWFGLFGCQFLDRDRPRLEVGVQFDSMSAAGSNNQLDYSHRPDVASLDKGVDLWTLMVSADVRVHRLLDVGLGIGRGRFTSTSDGLFDSLPKATFQPLRVTFRPLALLTAKHRAAELVAVRLSGTQFLDGFRDEEFGARPGTFSDPGELVLGWQVTVDVGALVWRR